MSSPSSPRRVVVTGLGAITPLGVTVDAYWKNLLDGVSGASEITKFDTEGHKSKIACEVRNFDATAYIDAKQARRQDLFSQYALAAAQQALDDAGIDTEAMSARSLRRRVWHRGGRQQHLHRRGAQHG